MAVGADDTVATARRAPVRSERVRESSPFEALLRRELLTLLRRTQTFLILCAFVGTVSVVIWASIPSTEDIAFRGAALARAQLGLGAVLLMGAALLFLPTLGATTIVGEREQDTLDLLKTSLITPTALVASKVIITCAFFALLFVGSIPALATPVFLVGVELSDVAYTLLLAAVTAIASSIAGVTMSSACRRTMTAVPLSLVAAGIVFIGAWTFVVPLLLTTDLFTSSGLTTTIIYSWSFWRRYEDVISVINATSPIGAFVMIRDDTFRWYHVCYLLAYQSIVCVALFRFALRRLDCSPRPSRYETEKPIDDAVVLRQRRKQFPYYLVDPLARKKPVEDGRNPMLVREVRWGVFHRATRGIRIFYISLMLFMVPMIEAYISDKMQPGMLFFQQLLLILFAPAVIANTLTKEYEMGNIDMLRMTLLRPGEIIIGKLIAGGIALLPVLAAVIVATAVPLTYVSSSPVMVTHSVFNLLLCTLISLAIGLFASLISPRTGRALVLSYVIAMAVYVLPLSLRENSVFIEPLEGAILLNWLNDAMTSAAQSPPVWFLAYWSPTYRRTVPAESWYVFSIWSAHAFLYTLFSIALIGLCIRVFATRKMRDV